MSGKTREFLLGVTLTLPIMVMFILFVIKHNMGFSGVIISILGLIVFFVLALTGVILALMFLRVIAYYFLKCVTMFLRDSTLLEEIPSVSISKEEISIIVAEAFLIVYCAGLYFLWRALIGYLPI